MQMDKDKLIAEALERYLVDAPVEHIRPLDGGGGHRRKMTLVLWGGVAVVAKIGDSEEMMRQARREAAAWVLATELGLTHLVPATVLRKLPDPEADGSSQIDGSAQVTWPRFETALAGGITPGSCAPAITWPIALFDLLLVNTDRKEDNWGTIDGMPRAVLIDHGHSFEAVDSHSGFVDLHREQTLPAELLTKLDRFHRHRRHSRLVDLLGDGEANPVFDRAASMLKYRCLTIR
jgi:hypothetical protein